jgi:protein-S-isoprenylcysteine O-methyltransferase Ste14
METIKYEQPNGKPVPKMVAVATAGAIVPAIVALLAAFGVIIPDDISSQAQSAMVAILTLVSAGQALIMFVSGYIKRDEKPVSVVETIKEVEERMKG